MKRYLSFGLRLVWTVLLALTLGCSAGTGSFSATAPQNDPSKIDTVAQATPTIRDQDTGLEVLAPKGDQEWMGDDFPRVARLFYGVGFKQEVAPMLFPGHLDPNLRDLPLRLELRAEEDGRVIGNPHVQEGQLRLILFSVGKTPPSCTYIDTVPIGLQPDGHNIYISPLTLEPGRIRILAYYWSEGKTTDFSATQTACTDEIANAEFGIDPKMIFLGRFQVGSLEFFKDEIRVEQNAPILKPK